jgi:hypothetical protein
MFHRYLSLFILLSFTFLNSCVITYLARPINIRIDEVRVDSTRGPYYTSRYPINSFSEKISIETRSIFFIGKITKKINLERNIDYIIDYNLGRIFFLRKIEAFDGEIHPNYINIIFTY